MSLFLGAINTLLRVPDYYIYCIARCIDWALSGNHITNFANPCSFPLIVILLAAVGSQWKNEAVLNPD